MSIPQNRWILSDSFTKLLSIGYINTKKKFAPQTFGEGPQIGHALFRQAQKSKLCLGRELGVKFIPQNYQKHHISGYGSRFQSARTFTFRDIGQNVFFGTPEGVKKSKFSIFWNFVMLGQGVNIGVFRPAESIPDVYLTLESLVFKLNAI